MTGVFLADLEDKINRQAGVCGRTGASQFLSMQHRVLLGECEGTGQRPGRSARGGASHIRLLWMARFQTGGPQLE